MQPAVGPPNVPGVRLALSPAEALDSATAPLLLRVGQRLLAEVLSVDGETGRALFAMAGRRFTAQAPLALEAGEVLRVAVAEASPDRLVLRLVPGDAPGPGGFPGVPGAPDLNPATILAELALPVTPDLEAAVVALLTRGRPLTQPALLAVRAAIAGQPAPAESARAAVYLQELGLPLTPRALALARAVLAESPPRPIGNLLRDLLEAGADPQLTALVVDTPTPEALEQAVTLLAEPPESALAQTLSADATPAALEAAVPETPETPGSAAVARGRVNARAGGDEAQRAGPWLPRNGASPSNATALASAVATAIPDAAVPLASASAPAVVTSAVAASTPDVVTAGSTTSGPTTSGPTTSAVPPELAPPADARTLLARTATTTDLPAAVRALAQTLHDRIELQQLSNAAASVRAGELPAGDADVAGPARVAVPLPGGTSAGVSQLPDALGGVTLPSPAAQLAQQSPLALAVSIPLAFAGQMTTLDLAIQRDPPSRRQGGEPAIAPVRAHLSLRLPRLGEVGVDLRMAGTALRCRLTPQEGPAHTLLAAATDELRARWQAAGFHVESLDCVPATPTAGEPRQPIHLRHVDLGA